MQTPIDEPSEVKISAIVTNAIRTFRVACRHCGPHLVSRVRWPRPKRKWSATYEPSQAFKHSARPRVHTRTRLAEHRPRPLTLKELRGRLVILDFGTHC